jgi:hypothetical protein
MTNQDVRFTPNRNPFRFSALRNGITQGYFLDVAELLPMDAGDAVGRGTDRAVSYYGQLWALVMLIRSDPAYSEGFKRLLSDAEEGRFAEELGMTPEQMASLRRNGRTYNRTISGPLFAHYISGDLNIFGRQYRSFARKLVGVE